MERAPGLEEFFEKQVTDGECQAIGQTVRHLASCYSYDSDGIFIMTAPVDGAFQKGVPVILCSSILYYSHHLTLAGHSREGCMHNTM